MYSKLEYLKRYGKTTKRKREKEKKSNLFVVDDDINWKLTANLEEGLDDSDEGPVVAEVQDESIVKWQPLSYKEEINVYEEDLSPPRKTEDLPKTSVGVMGDLSPPRKHQIKLDSGRNTNPSKGDGNNSVNNFPRKLQDKKSDKHEQPNIIEVTGKFAKTVYRDKAEEKNDDEDEVMTKNFKEWGRGYVNIMWITGSGVFVSLCKPQSRVSYVS